MNFWKDKKVLVTGGFGLIGGWLTEELLNKSAEVTLLRRDHVPKSRIMVEGIANRANIIDGKLEDYSNTLRTLNEYEIDSVFHLGAQAIVGTANRNPLSTFESNIRGTWSLLEACRNSKLIERTIIASSDKAYGTNDKLPYDEETPLKGEHPYDVSKSCCDLLAQAYFKTYGLPVVISRCGNVFGGGDLNFNRIVPGTIKSILFNENPIIRSDGTYVRDYFYVKDAVEAYLLLGENIVSNKLSGHAFNFSLTNKLSVLDIVNFILKTMNSSLKPTILNQVSGEIKHQYLDSTKARKILSWQPTFGLEQGMKETVDWYKKFFNKE
ncbi:NAD-dependent epimerase/dehydratase family protein [Candidatus Woesearchaeota archaeon]|nr:NAD-dependent epimerase/dehydratase family protein [Candidatus Woesearchaeota archaeon]